jgi:hypothetical protein
MSPRIPATTEPSAAPSFERVRRDLDHIRDVCRDEGDRNGYFAAMYSRVTAAVQRRAQAGRFDDAARMEAFVARFASRYTEAYWAHAAGQGATRSWELAFATAETSGPLVVQHLGLGMNAHINLDLGVVAAEIAAHEAGTATGAEPSASLQADFMAINDVLAELVERCQQAVVAASPLLGVADSMLASGDEDLTRFSLTVARAGAWQFARDLSTSQREEWAAMIDARDRIVADLGGRLLTSAGPADDLRRLVRLGEWRGIADVIDLLTAIDDA